MAKQSLLAKHLRSKSSAWSSSAILAAVPLSVSFGLFSYIPSYDASTNPESQTAVAEYMAENHEMMRMFNTISALRAASEQQNTPEDVIAFQQRKADKKLHLTELGADFTARILTDTRLTEKDYSRLRNEADIHRRTSYVSLPTGARALEESRMTAQNLSGEEQVAAIRTSMQKQDGLLMPKVIFGFLIAIFGLIAPPAMSFSRDGQKQRDRIADRLDQRAMRRRNKFGH